MYPPGIILEFMISAWEFPKLPGESTRYNPEYRMYPPGIILKFMISTWENPKLPSEAKGDNHEYHMCPPSGISFLISKNKKKTGVYSRDNPKC